MHPRSRRAIHVFSKEKTSWREGQIIVHWLEPSLIVCLNVEKHLGMLTEGGEERRQGGRRGGGRGTARRATKGSSPSQLRASRNKHAELEAACRSIPAE